MIMLQNLFLSGWCADSIGAQLEFQNKRFNEFEIDVAMSLTKRSKIGVYGGQITDDSEMEISLLEALVNSQNEEYFPIEKIAKNYIDWYKSNPFDIGQTTTLALSNANDAEDLINNAFEYNQCSESNGTLMRCIPLAIFGIKRTNEQLFEMVSSDCSLTHSNDVVEEITFVYCATIAEILRKKILNQTHNLNNMELLDKVYLSLKNEKVKKWFSLGLNLEINNYNSIINEGHIKHAFVYFIYFLQNINNYTYINAIKCVLSNGGDTDTNSKIIGNLFGAWYDNCIPQNILNAVINFDSNNVDDVYFKRPKKYSVQYGLELINNICL